LFLQPFLFLLLTTNEYIKSILLYVYVAYVFIQISLFEYMGGILPYATVENRHLVWNIHEKSELYPNLYKIIYLINLIWIFVYAYSVYQIKEYYLLAFGIITILLSVGIYKNNWGSMWCWMANGMMLWFVFRILIVLPFYEYSGVC
jgi:hypothetical protein